MRTALAAVLLLAPLSLRATPPPPPISALSPEAPSAEALAARALATVAAREPPIEVLQRAAAQVADHASSDPADYAGRARWAALLPHFTAEFRHEQADYRTVGLQSSGQVDYLRLQPSNTFLVRATWDLPSLVVVPGELQVDAQLAARARHRADAVEKVTKLYFERRKHRVALLVAPPGDPVVRAQAELEIARLGAEIDALTGGKLGEVAP